MPVQALVLWLALGADRVFGDPGNAFHPTAWLGRFIGWWGRPSLYRPGLQRLAGILMGILTMLLYALPFALFWRYAPLLLIILAGPFLLKICFAWRCLEEHVSHVVSALENGGGETEVQMLVSRDASALDNEGILSAAYESMAENLVDSITSPLFFFAIGGLGSAALFRAVNTMDAMLGYKDERVRIGWFAARLDDILNYIPARLTGLVLLFWFACRGRFRQAWHILRRDACKRSGFNGGIPMAVIAGGAGIRFRKAGVYEIGDPEKSLYEGGDEIVLAVRAATLIWAVLITGFTFLML